MIVHSVKFERRIANAKRVDDVAVRGARITDRKPHVADSAPLPADATAATTAKSADTTAATTATVELLRKISQGIDKVQIQIEPLVKEMQQMSIRLATTMVKKIVGSSESLQAKRLEQLVAEAFRQPEPVVAIHVNPHDQATLVAYLAEQELANLETKPDKNIEQGECRIECSSHELISSLEYQLTELEHQLLEVIHDDAG